MVVTKNTDINELEIRVNNVNLKDIIELHEQTFGYDKNFTRQKINQYRGDYHAIIVSAHDLTSNKLAGYHISTSLTHAKDDIPHKSEVLLTLPDRIEKILYLHYAGISPEFRRQGLWLKLFQKTLDEAKSFKYTHFMGFFKEDSSYHGIKKMMGEPLSEYPADGIEQGVNYHRLTYPISNS